MNDMEETKNTAGLLSAEEMSAADKCMKFALEHGAQKVRITLNKSCMDLFGMLNGELDKVAHALDRSISLSLFVDGRFGTFSSNRISDKELEDFILKAIDTVKMLAPDTARDLPSPDRTARDAMTGREAGLYDAGYEKLDAGTRLKIAEKSSSFRRRQELEHGFTLISEEGEYSDSVFDCYIIDSNGLKCRHTETSFEIGYEATVADAEGNRYSGYWWDASPESDKLSSDECSAAAIARAAAQIGPKHHDGGKMNMVVDSEVASKLVNPLLNALNAYSIQQKNSFLTDRLGEKVFSENLSIIDMPRCPGVIGSRFFDSEGVATHESPIIDKGRVSRYFVNTYMANKMGIDPTVEESTRATVLPFGGCRTRDELLQKVGSGILVCGFNGGNSNSSTGDFSYGIEGFLFENGRILHPVREMVITGNFITLWSNLLATADDARSCMAKRIPSLAFGSVDIRG